MVSRQCVVVYDTNTRQLEEPRSCIYETSNYQLWQYGETRPRHTTTSLSMARTINDIMLTTSNPKQSRGGHWIELHTCVHVHFTFLEQTELLSPVRTRGKELGAHSTARVHEFTWHGNCSQQQYIKYKSSIRGRQLVSISHHPLILPASTPAPLDAKAW